MADGVFGMPMFIILVYLLYLGATCLLKGNNTFRKRWTLRISCLLCQKCTSAVSEITKPEVNGHERVEKNIFVKYTVCTHLNLLWIGFESIRGHVW